MGSPFFRFRRALSLTLSALVFLTACTAHKSQDLSGPPAYESYCAGALEIQQKFDAFTEKLFLEEVDNSLLTLHYTLADPGSAGIVSYPRTFGSLSLEDSKKASQSIRQLLDVLNEIPSSQLRPDQLLTFQILREYLTAQSLGQGLELYDQPLSSSLGIQAQLPILLAEYAFYSPQDVEDYLALVSQIDAYYQEILEFEQHKSQAGLGLCDWAIDRIVQSCKAYLMDAPQDSFLVSTFERRLEQLSGLTPEEADQYASRNLQAVIQHFIPAYELLIQELPKLKGMGTNEMGLAHMPKGQEYYEYLVRSCTGTSYESIQALEAAIQNQMDLDLEGVRGLLAQNPSLIEQADAPSYKLQDPEAIMEDLKLQCARDFPVIQDCSYEIRQVPEALEPVLSPAFYLTVPLDRPEDNCIYINPAGTDPFSLYPTLAHEGYPGHMYQNQYFTSTETCSLRKLLNFTSYSEGWATYVEYYSYALDNGLDPDVGQLLKHNSSFTLALYALLDIKIHFHGWTPAQTLEFLQVYIPSIQPSSTLSIYRDIVENPVNYLEYYIGYLEILQMQQEAQAYLNERYRALDFHTFLLDIGPAPFTVIRPYFNAWLARSSN